MSNGQESVRGLYRQCDSVNTLLSVTNVVEIVEWCQVAVS